MRRTLTSLLTTMVMWAMLLALTVSSASAQSRIAFNRSNQATVTGSVSRAQSKKYIFSGKAGQRINISLRSDAVSLMAIHVSSNATGRMNDESEGETGDMTEKTFTATLPGTGDYAITIGSGNQDPADFELQLTLN